ncbi:hypothetical protein COY52_10485 [Candidatus Desantisbacteria bacterium CG_4_10_14_0_8_um_filter_48_22]|uniref:DUF5683 domain-containing protein n=1 Tax=Candidatus Desantisbacteria bacterium CG_4_10_14_0_8_um_filter_48_22 TaxID=1974543 RepID=A0A2M7S703_9BACT|nr:MAG: hypothetical protein AUJ67_09510 [Candidatus Desantisbacteria bacterium CG1_02_49_89]PIV55057.1 MAG: hypothetical protein COS16_08525 [Candidatus Desantisbacteria bacterium CG02_land_8_20_14_3_00_49_13]PIZ15103.1 MAG: hypothetical protein COY52_10485 [Candidatus Desantisbacteria bacterium CG_4_10_14_0_8_um_filter_48_22]PJB28947.1 MAG: hypothetical protein CO111_00250 [Candidatus Desantisbacteria bacterium CG_4_9_14_3_um_filter_50_7]
MRKKLLVIVSIIFINFPVAFNVFAEDTEGLKNPWVSTGLSCLWPGLGQIYSGGFDKGLSCAIVIPLGIWRFDALKPIACELPSPYQDYLVQMITDFQISLYIGNIADAYLTAVSHNNKDYLKKKSLDQAMFFSLIFPGGGDIYVGDAAAFGFAWAGWEGFFLFKIIFPDGSTDEEKNKIRLASGFGALLTYGAQFATAALSVWIHNINVEERLKKNKQPDVSFKIKYDIQRENIALAICKSF